MNKDTKIGVILGLNLAMTKMFGKVWSAVHSETLCHHDLLPALSEDLEAITELIEKQREIIEEVSETVGAAHEGH